MAIDDITLHKLDLYYCKHIEGALLGNEPASLLCEHLESHVTSSPEDSWEAAIKSWLGDSDLERLGEDGSLGGVRVTIGRKLSFANYGRGEKFHPLVASQLLRLAQAAEITNEPAPVPDWEDEAWNRPPSEFDPDIERLSSQAVVEILAAHKVPLRIYDGIPTFSVNGDWLDDEKWALTELLKLLPEEKRNEILNFR